MSALDSYRERSEQLAKMRMFRSVYPPDDYAHAIRALERNVISALDRLAGAQQIERMLSGDLS